MSATDELSYTTETNHIRTQITWREMIIYRSSYALQCLTVRECVSCYLKMLEWGGGERARS